jgi:hypothetical protein
MVDYARWEVIMMTDVRQATDRAYASWEAWRAARDAYGAGPVVEAARARWESDVKAAAHECYAHAQEGRVLVSA